MEVKTRVSATESRQELLITRDFDLPVELLFKAYVEREFLEQWMGTKVVKLESKRHGSYQFLTTDPKGNTHGFSGVIHEFVPNEKITRTFEMENTTFPVQLEYLEFHKVTNTTSKLTIQIIFRSVSDRDQLMQLPFAQGINFAHNRLQETLFKLI